MIVYQTDHQGFYLRPVMADPNPRPDPQVPNDDYLIPAGCVLVKPPNLSAGYRAKWDGVEWVLVETVVAPPPEELTPEEQLALARETWVMSDVQFAIAASAPEFGFMTDAEALDWAGAGIIPAIGVAALAAIEDENVRREATIRFRGARSFARLDPLILQLQAFLNLSDATVDAFFQYGMTR